jgi:hypothetical protein
MKKNQIEILELKDKVHMVSWDSMMKGTEEIINELEQQNIVQ